jgi:hypothetical protein
LRVRERNAKKDGQEQQQVDEAAKGQGISPEGHISSMYQKDSVHRLAGNSVVGSKVVRFAGESVAQELGVEVEEEKKEKLESDPSTSRPGAP